MNGVIFGPIKNYKELCTLPSSDVICSYLRRWLKAYPSDSPWIDSTATAACRSAEDSWLDQFDGRHSLRRSEVVELVEWKFVAANRRLQAMTPVNGSWHLVDTSIRWAIHHNNDLAALDALLNIPGWGAAMASAILTATRPCKYTVGDIRALNTLDHLGLMPGVAGQNFGRQHWLPYLDVCRNLSQQCSISLRDVDRALWAAKGRP
jgi:hypothetical protein